MGRHMQQVKIRDSYVGLSYEVTYHSNLDCGEDDDSCRNKHPAL